MSFYRRERDYLDVLLDGLGSGSRILDLGCGTGRPMAEYIVARGHRITGVDQAEELLRLASTRLPHQEWIHSPLEDFPFNGTYDGVICWDSLFHLERGHHVQILSGIFRCLVPGGRVMLTVGGSEHPAFVDTMFGQEFFYDSYPPEKVRSILLDLGFEILIGEFINQPTSGRDKGRYAIVAQKVRPSLAAPPA